MTSPISFKCIVSNCPRNATRQSAACAVHLAVETVVLAAVGAAILWMMIYVVLSYQ